MLAAVIVTVLVTASALVVASGALLKLAQLLVTAHAEHRKATHEHQLVLRTQDGSRTENATLDQLVRRVDELESARTRTELAKLGGPRR